MRASVHVCVRACANFFRARLVLTSTLRCITLRADPDKIMGQRCVIVDFFDPKTGHWNTETTTVNHLRVQVLWVPEHSLEQREVKRDHMGTGSRVLCASLLPVTNGDDKGQREGRLKESIVPSRNSKQAAAIKEEDGRARAWCTCGNDGSDDTRANIEIGQAEADAKVEFYNCESHEWEAEDVPLRQLAVRIPAAEVLPGMLLLVPNQGDTCRYKRAQKIGALVLDVNFHNVGSRRYEVMEIHEGRRLPYSEHVRRGRAKSRKMIVSDFPQPEPDPETANEEPKHRGVDRRLSIVQPHEPRLEPSMIPTTKMRSRSRVFTRSRPATVKWTTAHALCASDSGPEQSLKGWRSQYVADRMAHMFKIVDGRDGTNQEWGKFELRDNERKGTNFLKTAGAFEVLYTARDDAVLRHKENPAYVKYHDSTTEAEFCGLFSCNKDEKNGGEEERKCEDLKKNIKGWETDVHRVYWWIYAGFAIFSMFIFLNAMVSFEVS